MASEKMKNCQCFVLSCEICGAEDDRSTGRQDDEKMGVGRGFGAGGAELELKKGEGAGIVGGYRNFREPERTSR